MIDWNSSALWGIIGLLGGFFISLLFHFISKKKKVLAYTINPTALITNEISAIPSLDILYSGKKINNLTSTHISLKNAGNEIIEESDFASLSPLKIHIENGEIFSSEYINNCINDVTDKNMNIRLEAQNECVLIHFEFLPPQSSFNITIFHTGTMTLSGDLKKGKFIDSKQLFTQKLKVLKWCLIFLGILLGLYIFLRYILPLLLALFLIGGIAGGLSDTR